MTRNMSLFAFLIAAAPSACTDAEPAALSLAVERLDVGQVDCGTTRTAQLTVSNPGGELLELDASSTLAGVSVKPPHATVAPGETITLDVVVAMPAAGTPGFVATGDLVIASNGGDATIPLTVETSGTVVSLAQPVVDFGEFLPGSSMTRDLVVRASRTGVADLAVSLDLPPAPFEVIGERTRSLSSGEATFQVRLAAGTAPQRYDATLPIAVQGSSVCAAPAVAVPMSGIATTDAFMLDRTVVDLGEVRCGDSPSTGTIGVTNRGASEIHYSAWTRDWFSLDVPEPSSGDLTPGQSARIAVHSKKLFSNSLPPGPFTGRVEISLIPSSVVKTVPVRGTIFRSVLELPISDFDLGYVPVGGTATGTFRVFNRGNVPAAVIASPAHDISVSPQRLVVAPNESQVITFTVVVPSLSGGFEWGGGSINVFDEEQCNRTQRVFVHRDTVAP